MLSVRSSLFVAHWWYLRHHQLYLNILSLFFIFSSSMFLSLSSFLSLSPSSLLHTNKLTPPPFQPSKPSPTAIHHHRKKKNQPPLDGSDHQNPIVRLLKILSDTKSPLKIEPRIKPTNCTITKMDELNRNLAWIFHSCFNWGQ